MNTRNQRILKGVDVAHGKGLEIGPLTSPILTKPEADVYYLDHMSTKELKEKYKSEPVELDKIVDVDFVVGRSSLAEAVKGNKFDYVIASHVIEHIPNTVSWLRELETVLRPGGVVCLIIPDKRFIFDMNRRITLPGEIIGAYLDRLTRFNSSMMYDFASNCLESVDTAEAWANPEKFVSAPRRWTPQEVLEKCQKNLDPSHYEDCHCYVFTPASFLDIMRELMEHQLLNFEVANFIETNENEIEFYVNLRKVDIKKISLNKQLSTLPVTTPERDAIGELEEQVMVLQQELEALKSSVSWRSTKVLRTVRGVQKKLKP